MPRGVRLIMTPPVLFLEEISTDETSCFEVISSDGSKTYDVMHDVDHHWICTCPDYYFRKHFCKHMKACAELKGIDDNMVYEEVRHGHN